MGRGEGGACEEARGRGQDAGLVVVGGQQAEQGAAAVPPPLHLQLPQHSLPYPLQRDVPGGRNIEATCCSQRPSLWWWPAMIPRGAADDGLLHEHRGVGTPFFISTLHRCPATMLAVTNIFHNESRNVYDKTICVRRSLADRQEESCGAGKPMGAPRHLGDDELHGGGEETLQRHQLLRRDGRVARCPSARVAGLPTPGRGGAPQGPLLPHLLQLPDEALRAGELQQSWAGSGATMLSDTLTSENLAMSILLALIY